MTCVRNTQMTIAIPPHAAEVWVKCIFQKQIAAFSDRQCSCLSELKHYLSHSRRSILRTFKCHCHIYLLCAYFSLQQYQYFPPLSFDRYQVAIFVFEPNEKLKLWTFQFRVHRSRSIANHPNKCILYLCIKVSLNKYFKRCSFQCRFRHQKIYSAMHCI